MYFKRKQLYKINQITLMNLFKSWYEIKFKYILLHADTRQGTLAYYQLIKKKGNYFFTIYMYF
jgi:hypothetical protein